MPRAPRPAPPVSGAFGFDLGAGPCSTAPASLGVRVVGGTMSVLLPVGTPLPAEVRRMFATVEHDQAFIALEIFAGEDPLVTDNRQLGRLVLTDLPLAPRGEIWIEVLLILGRDGFLSVAAYERHPRTPTAPPAVAPSSVAIARPSPTSEVARANAHAARDEWMEAIEVVARLVTRDPQARQFQMLLAYLCGCSAEAAGHVAEALEHYRAALRIDPDFTAARAALAKLVARE